MNSRVITVCLQLFARLEARRSLKDIETRLFPEDGGPDQGDMPRPLPVSTSHVTSLACERSQILLTVLLIVITNQLTCV